MGANAQQTPDVAPQIQQFLGRDHGLFIGGRSVAARAAEQVEVRNPATDEIIARVPDAGEADVDRAVRAADQAYRDGCWSGLRPADRERLLLRFADAVEAHGEEFAQLETLNQGKSIAIARMLDVGGAVEYMRYMAGWATKIYGQTLDVSIPIPPGARYSAYTRREPIGVVAGIVPWNFPMMIGLWKVMPALACGNTIVLKPSEETPLTALRIAELAVEVGIPEGVFNVVTGRGESTGAVLVSHPLVRKISFTGSTEVGRKIGRAALENMTRFSLELGGKNPVIVLDDVDIEPTVQGALMGAMLNSGQVCAAASRFYVHKSIYDKVVTRMAELASAMPLGPGGDPASQITPLVSRTHQQRVLAHLETARREGAEVVTGGCEPEGMGGYYVRPTVLAAVRPQMACVREEIFGPVLAAMPFEDVEQALRETNDSAYGLSASVWTNDLKAAMNLIPKIEAGTVWVNTHVVIDPNMPFGGYKQSGIGREFGSPAIEGFTALKSVCIAQ